MLDENQGGQAAAEREPTPGTEQGQQERPRDEAGRFVPQEGGDEQGEREEGDGGEGGEPQAEEAGRTEEERQEQPREEEKEWGEKGKTPASVQRRFGEMTRRTREAEQRAEALQAQLDRIQIAGGRISQDERAAAEHQVRQDNPALDDDQVTAKALKIVQEREYIQECNKVHSEGIKEFKDFQQAIDEFVTIGGLQQDFLNDVLAAGSSHKILYHLGRDLDEAERIISMDPRKRMAALTRLSDKLSAPPSPRQISRAPAPINPVGGAGRASSLNDSWDSITMEEFNRRRDRGESPPR